RHFQCRTFGRSVTSPGARAALTDTAIIPHHVGPASISRKTRASCAPALTGPRAGFRLTFPLPRRQTVPARGLPGRGHERPCHADRHHLPPRRPRPLRPLRRPLRPRDPHARPAPALRTVRTRPRRPRIPAPVQLLPDAVCRPALAVVLR